SESGQASQETADGGGTSSYSISFQTSSGGDMLNLGTAMGANDDITSSGQVRLNSGGSQSSAYAGTGSDDYTTSDIRTQSSWSMGQTQEGSNSASQNIQYVATRNSYTANGTQN